MSCCVGHQHSDWCKDYPIVYVDEEGNEYCIFHAPADKKFMELNGKKIDSIDFNKEVHNRIAYCIFKDEEYWKEVASQQSTTKNDENIARYSVQSETKQQSKEDDKQTGSENWNPISNLSGTIFPWEIDFSKYHFESCGIPSTSFEDCLFKKDVNFSGLFCQNDLSFEGSKFKGKLSFYGSKIDGDLWFSNCIFHEYVDFTHCFFLGETRFTTSQFREEADFDHSYFKRYACFGEIVFRGLTSFDESEFYDGAGFDFSQFRENVHFSKCQFLCNVSFFYVQFRKILGCVGTLFKKKVFFCLSECRRQVLFNKAIFNIVVFSNMHFEDYVNFENSVFVENNEYKTDERLNDQITFKHCIFKEWIYFREVKFKGNISFIGNVAKEKILMDDCNLSKLSLLKANIESFLFVDCVWDSDSNSGSRRRSKRIIRDELELKESVEQFKNNEMINGSSEFIEESGVQLTKDSEKEKEKDPKEALIKKYRALEDTYRRLKKVAQINNDQMAASDWHYREKDMVRKRLHLDLGPSYGEKIIKKFTSRFECECDFIKEEVIKIHRYFDEKSVALLRAANFFYFVVSGYGEEPLRAFSWLLFALSFPLLFALWGPGEATLKAWMWYMPLLNIDIQVSNGWFCVFKAFSIAFITIQATLLGFSLRNKFRR